MPSAMATALKGRSSIISRRKSPASLALSRIGSSGCGIPSERDAIQRAVFDHLRVRAKPREVVRAVLANPAVVHTAPSMLDVSCRCHELHALPGAT
jgi:hypothetical protein